MFKYDKDYAWAYDICQRVGMPSCHNELSLHHVRVLQAFEKWVVDLISPINPLANNSRERYIITTIDYLT